MNRQERLLRIVFIAGAVTDALALLPLLFPPMARMLWGFEDASGAYRFATGYAAALMLGWTLLLLWAWRSPLERKAVALLTNAVIAGLILAEVAAVLDGALPVSRVLPTWVLQAALLALFATAYHLKPAGQSAQPHA
jgi:hypothetical protein